MRPILVLAVLALLVGCGDGRPAAAPSPSLTIPSEAFNSGLSQTDAAADVTFLAHLSSSGVPYATGQEAISAGRIACANMSADARKTKEQVARLLRFGSYSRAVVDAAIAAYCPEFKDRP